MESVPLPPKNSLPIPEASVKPLKLDLSRLPDPGALEKVNVEEVTIDGICGVY